MPFTRESFASFGESLKQGGFLIALGYMMYALWDSLERSRYLIAYQGAGEIPILWSPAFLTVALLCALASFLVQKRLLKSVYLRPLKIAVPLVSAASSVVLCLQRLAGETPSPLLIATFGLSIAWYLLVWTERFGALGGRKTFGILIVADALSAILQYIFVGTMNSYVLLVTTALLPLLSALILFVSPRVETEKSLETKASLFSWSWVLSLAIAAFGAIYFLLRSVLYIHPYSYVSPSIIPIGSLATLALLLLLALVLPRGERFVRLFIPAALGLVSLLFIAALILMPFVQMDELWSVLVVMGNRCGFIMLMLGLAEICYQQQVKPLAVFGAGLAAFYAGYSLGGFLGVYLAQYSNGYTSLLLGCSLLALLFVALAFYWLFRNNAKREDKRVTTEALLQERKALTCFNELFDQAVQDISERYRLSPRETEIFALLARGRSGSYISENLFISLNTTKKHVQNIYRKLEIHSNQEIIDLIDQDTQ